jgi:two-component system sensor histidine kinase CpxA
VKSLFVRVISVLLGSFLLVALLSALLFKWASHELDPHERHYQRMSRTVAEEVVVAYSQGEIADYRLHLGRKFQAQTWIMDSAGKPLESRPVPESIRSQVTHYPVVIHPRLNTSGRFFIFAHQVEYQGATYQVILSSQTPLLGGKHRFWFVMVSVLIVILGLVSASALLSYWMLRPIQSIRNTTSEISETSLDSRIPAVITSRNDAFGDLGREFNQMADRVQSSIENQNQLLRDVSHELRSPLARIQVAASLSQQKYGAREEFDRIESEVERLNNLIEDLISLSRLKNRSALKRENIELRSLLGNIIGDANFEFQQTGQTCELAGDLAATVNADRDLLSSLFENVIRNGLRYSPEREVLAVRISALPGLVRITFTDKGPGVNPSELERIFDPFYRADDARSTSNGHHGIGLALARAIVEVHGGNISARNRDSGGLEISLEFPAV